MADPAQITAWQRLGPELTASGALSERDVAALAGPGVAHVANRYPQALAGIIGSAKPRTR
jgi:hypothetical protein